MVINQEISATYPNSFKYWGRIFSSNGKPRGSAAYRTVCCIPIKSISLGTIFREVQHYIPVCMGYFPVISADLEGVQIGAT